MKLALPTQDPEEPEYFVSVMVPHGNDIKPSDITGKRHRHEGGRMVAPDEKNEGIVTTLSETGNVEVTIHPWKDSRKKAIEINMRNDGDWSVER